MIAPLDHGFVPIYILCPSLFLLPRYLEVPLGPQ
jgi:hypothetical protein